MTFTPPGTVGPGANASLSQPGPPVLGHPDPFGYGMVMTYPPIWNTTATALNNGQAAYMKYVGWGLTVAALRIVVGTSVGNIDVGVYGNVGAGAASLPGPLLAHSGVIPCPAAGLATIALPAPINLPAGGWFALWTDSATASFRNASSTIVAANAGVNAYNNPPAGGLPNPASAFFLASPTNADRYLWISSP